MVYQKNILIIFFTLFLFVDSGTSQAQSFPLIHLNRPRIWADSVRFTWLQSNINSGDCGATYTDFKYRYDNYWITDPQLYLAGNDSTLWAWNWNSVYARDEALYTAFLFKLNGDALSLKRCIFILNRYTYCIDTANFTTMDWYIKETLLRTLSDAGDLILDWCYNSLPVQKRQRLSLSIFKMNREFMATYILSGAGNSYVSSHNAYNSVQTMQNATTLYQADGLSASKLDSVWTWYTILYTKWTTGFLPIYGYYRNTNGGWNWGAAYSMWSLTDQFKLFDNMLIGTTKNFFTDLPWVLNSINQYWYFNQPDNYCIHLGDGVTLFQGDNVIYRHASLFQDPRSMWMSQYFSQPSFMTYTLPVFNKLFYKDFTLLSVSKPNPPLDWLSDKVGLSVSRTSWDSTSTIVWFFNSWSKKASHEHADNNTFAIYKYAPLIIDAGFYDLYGSTHFKNYYTRTIAHNSVCVFDSTEHFYYGSEPVSNDGGQIYSPPMMNYNDIIAPQFQRGRWILYGSGNGYCYNIADAKLSYDTTKLDRFTRRLLYFKPDKVIILDHLHLKNSPVKQRIPKWVVHFSNQPDVNGTIISTNVPNHIETFSGRDYTMARNGGNVAIRTLLPSSTSTTRIGGTGYEYWVNNTNYPPTGPIDTIHSTPGNWRLEVTPNQITDSLIFLHTLKIGDSIVPSLPGGIGQLNQFTAGAKWDSTLFFFSAKGDTGTDYQILTQIPGNQRLGIFAADLIPECLFNILVDHTIIATIRTDQHGILQLQEEWLSSGNHTIEIERKPGTVIVNEKGKLVTDLISVFPNPTNEILTIDPRNNNGEYIEFTLYTQEGSRVLSSRTKQKEVINIRHFAAGTYWMEAHDTRHQQVMKIIVIH
jgi:hypothetical protein